MKLARGDVALVDLSPTVGHEQRGLRPCVVVSDPDVISAQRFAMVCVVPLTGTPGKGALCPLMAPGPSGLKIPSAAMVDHLKSIDKKRIRGVFGRVSRMEQRAIDVGLALFLGLGSRAGP